MRRLCLLALIVAGTSLAATPRNDKNTTTNTRYVEGAAERASGEFKEADVIHLHWVNQGLLSLNDIKKMTQSGKPMVWTMHDMWACTGICHHARE